ncbi:MAG: cytochrome c [Phyllobacteriaceae bacterium]|nr:cytochrome c [Phyllobacteriaceae bacterium]
MRPAVAAICLAWMLAANAAAAADAEKGRLFLQERCGGCHATDATGDSPLPAAPAFRQLGERYSPETLEESLAEGIVTGHPGMPEVVATPEEIDDIVAWLNAVQAAPKP